MIRTTIFLLVASLALCTTASADYIIDDFANLDTPNDGSATTTSPTGEVTVEVSSMGAGAAVALVPGVNIYTMTAAGAGDTFEFAYDWAGLYQDLTDANVNERIFGAPVGVLVGALADWTLTIDRGVLGSTVFNPATSDLGGLQISAADELTFTFEYTGAGTSILAFGGSPLLSTPEPTSLIMLGSVAMLGLSRRRRKA